MELTIEQIQIIKNAASLLTRKWHIHEPIAVQNTKLLRNSTIAEAIQILINVGRTTQEEVDSVGVYNILVREVTQE